MLLLEKSLLDAIKYLKLNREKLLSKMSDNEIDQLLFNLEEINLDIERLSQQIIEPTETDEPMVKLSHTFDFFQYGSLPHIQGHLETIEALLESRQSSPYQQAVTNNQ